ncbi:MAG: TolB family protein [Opitutales bacterium]
MNRILSLLFVVLSPLLLRAQGKVVVNDEITAVIASGKVTVAVVSDDRALGDLVQFALSLHGAIVLQANSPRRVVVSRQGVSASVACDAAPFAFQQEVRGRDEEDLALQVADAIVVGLGRPLRLRPLYAGTKVAFTSRASGFDEICKTTLARARTLILTSYRNTSISPRWSADGTRINFISSLDGFPGLYTTNGIGAPRALLTGVRGAIGAASSGPDGRLIFVSSNKGTMDVYVADANAKGARRLIAAAGSQVVNADPAWSPDGSRIALTSGPTGRPGIYLASAAGGTPSRVPTGYSYATEPRWSPVENKLVFTFQSGRLGLAVADLSAGTVQEVPAASAFDLSHASWCADGRHVVATQASRSSSWLAVVDTVSGKVSRLSPPQLGSCSQPDCWTRKP